MVYKKVFSDEKNRLMLQKSNLFPTKKQVIVVRKNISCRQKQIDVAQKIFPVTKSYETPYRKKEKKSNIWFQEHEKQ